MCDDKVGNLIHELMLIPNYIDEYVSSVPKENPRAIMSCDLLKRLHELRTDLVDLAFALERRGQMEAADVAITTSARLQELCDESAGGSDFPQPDQSGQSVPVSPNR